MCMGVYVVCLGENERENLEFCIYCFLCVDYF